MIPIVQIVHYSDLHIVGPDYLQQRVFLDRIYQALPASSQQGLARASIAALQAFETFLRTEIAGDAQWRDRPVWLVDTGDGTTFGDSESLALWLDQWSPRFLAAAGPHARQLVLYGNHDAWPGTFPLLAPTRMDTQRDELRKRWFPTVWPEAPLSAPIPSSNGSQVQLYALNSVDHELSPNFRALGKTLPDRFWEHPAPMIGPTAVDDLRRCVALHAGATDQHCRLLAMHYPVCAETNTKRITEILANRDDVAAELRGKSPTPLIHLLLGGHTHLGYPPIGLFPNGLESVSHAPLPPGHCQSVVASLSQLTVAGPAPASPYYPDQCALDCPYQCSILRIYEVGPAELLVERITAGRPRGGHFAFLPVAPGSNRFAEGLTITL